MQVLLFSHCIIVQGAGAGAHGLAGLPSHPCINDSCVLATLTRATGKKKNEPCFGEIPPETEMLRKTQKKERRREAEDV